MKNLNKRAIVIISGALVLLLGIGIVGVHDAAKSQASLTASPAASTQAQTQSDSTNTAATEDQNAPSTTTPSTRSAAPAQSTPAQAPSTSTPSAGTSDPNLSNGNTYTNVDGNTVHSPAASTNGSIPAGATAQCSDGTYSFSQHRSGTCSGHGGVGSWL